LNCSWKSLREENRKKEIVREKPKRGYGRRQVKTTKCFTRRSLEWGRKRGRHYNILSGITGGEETAEKHNRSQKKE